jgi:hypothetical protein
MEVSNVKREYRLFVNSLKLGAELSNFTDAKIAEVAYHTNMFTEARWAA